LLHNRTGLQLVLSQPFMAQHPPPPPAISIQPNSFSLRTHCIIKGWDSSVSIVSGYRLVDRARSPAEAMAFPSSLCVQTSFEARPASHTMGTGDRFPGGKARPGRDADHSPHLVTRSRMRSYLSSTPCSPHGGIRTAVLCFH
jgi:hypothetical protein